MVHIVFTALGTLFSFIDTSHLKFCGVQRFDIELLCHSHLNRAALQIVYLGKMQSIIDFCTSSTPRVYCFVNAVRTLSKAEGAHSDILLFIKSIAFSASGFEVGSWSIFVIIACNEGRPWLGLPSVGGFSLFSRSMSITLSTSVTPCLALMSMYIRRNL